MKKEKKEKIITVAIVVSLFLLMAYLTWANANTDKGDYDYCVEWEGLNSGTLHRDSLLYTCYSLAKSEFLCDYDIDRNTQILIVKPIINTTKGADGLLTSITYDEPNYFECIRWLKSRRNI